MQQRDFENNEHFVRLCSRQRQIIDESGNIVGVTWEAFSLRPERNETYLSGALLDCCNNPQIMKLRSSIEMMKIAGLTVTPKHAVIVASAGDLKHVGRRHSRRLRVRHEPKKKNAYYSAVRGIPLDNSDLKLLSMLADHAVSDVYLVSQL